MKRLIIILALLFMATQGFAITVDHYMTANTVSYNTAGMVITFNTVVNHIKVVNEGSEKLFVTFDNLGWTDNRTEYLLPTTIDGAVYETQPVVRLLPISDANAKESVFEINFSTDKIGFITDCGSGTVSYSATTDTEQP